MKTYARAVDTSDGCTMPVDAERMSFAPILLAAMSCSFSVAFAVAIFSGCTREDLTATLYRDDCISPCCVEDFDAGDAADIPEACWTGAWPTPD